MKNENDRKVGMGDNLRNAWEHYGAKATTAILQLSILAGFAGYAFLGTGVDRVSAQNPQCGGVEFARSSSTAAFFTMKPDCNKLNLQLMAEKMGHPGAGIDWSNRTLKTNDIKPWEMIMDIPPNTELKLGNEVNGSVIFKGPNGEVIELTVGQVQDLLNLAAFGEGGQYSGDTSSDAADESGNMTANPPIYIAPTPIPNSSRTYGEVEALSFSQVVFGSRLVQFLIGALILGAVWKFGKWFSGSGSKPVRAPVVESRTTRDNSSTQSDFTWNESIPETAARTATTERVVDDTRSGSQPRIEADYPRLGDSQSNANTSSGSSFGDYARSVINDYLWRVEIASSGEDNVVDGETKDI